MYSPKCLAFRALYLLSGLSIVGLLVLAAVGLLITVAVAEGAARLEQAWRRAGGPAADRDHGARYPTALNAVERPKSAYAPWRR